MRALMLASALTLAAVGAVIGVAVATHSNSVDVRVAARSTESDSIEFAIQQRLPDGSWSDYRYGRARFFGPSLHDGRWKHATPVQVEVPGVHVATAVATPEASEQTGKARTQQSWYFIDDENRRDRGCKPLNDDNRLRLSLRHDNQNLAGDVNYPSPPSPDGIGWCYKAGGIIGEGYEHMFDAPGLSYHGTTTGRAYLNRGQYPVHNLFVTVSTPREYFFMGCMQYELNRTDTTESMVTRNVCYYNPTVNMEQRGVSHGINLLKFDDDCSGHTLRKNCGLLQNGENRLCVAVTVLNKADWERRWLNDTTISGDVTLGEYIRNRWMDVSTPERFCFDFKVVW